MSESEKVDDDTCDSDCIPGGPHSNACVARAQFSYVPPSPAALAKLDAGIESAKTRPLVTRESYAQYADDDEQLTDEERAQLELAIEVENYPIAKLLRLHDRLKARVAELEDLLDEAGDCMGLDAVDMVGRIDAALGRVKAQG